MVLIVLDVVVVLVALVVEMVELLVLVALDAVAFLVPEAVDSEEEDVVMVDEAVLSVRARVDEERTLFSWELVVLVWLGDAVL